MEEKEKIGKALLKVALGFQVAEVTEEFSEVDGELKLTKRKQTKKDVPPDLKAVQILLAEGGAEGYGTMSDEELEREKRRLLAELEAETEKPLKTEKTEKRAGQVCVEKEAAAKKPRAKPRKRVVRNK